MHSSQKQLEEWKEKINYFLNECLKLELHPDKSKIIPLSRGIDFIGFRNFFYNKLLRKRNIRAMENKIKKFSEGEIELRKLFDIYLGWQAYAKWANAYILKEKIKIKIVDAIWNKLEP